MITSQEKEKRSVLYYSDISDMFPVTGGNFIHTCMHVHIVFAGVRVCVRAGRRVCVCVKQIHTHSSRVFAGVAAGAGSGARLRCQTRELPSVAAGARSGTHSSRELASPHSRCRRSPQNLASIFLLNRACKCHQLDQPFLPCSTDM